ncbi:MAG: polyprenyl synthetase family protein [Eubacteriales bacterium]|nr:polyprenyl synthetase family protein [Eubacteriales bacterium]
MNIKEEMVQYRKRFDNIYNDNKKTLEVVKNECPILYDAIDYSIEAGGKRLRPFLLYEIYKSFTKDKVDTTYIEKFELALEMIHTFSLIHDDLPQIDNSQTRRGKESTWKKYGEDTALLSGDALIFCALNLIDIGHTHLLQNYKDSVREEFILNMNEKYLACKETFSSYAGIYGLVLGEARDTLFYDENLTRENLDYTYEMKTGALFSIAFKVGSIIAGADKYICDKMGQIGLTFGKVFQIQDDILDASSTEEKIGKPIGIDVINKKITYVTLFGIEESKKIVENEYNNIINDLTQIEEETKSFEYDTKANFEKLKEIISFLIHREN